MLAPKKVLDKDAVVRVAEELASPYVTTLEIKEKLRGEGYYATQGEVSTYMQELVSDGSWDSELASDWPMYSLEPYNYYYMVEEEDEDEDEDETGYQDVVFFRNMLDTECFVLASYNAAGPVVYTEKSVSRNVARAAYEAMYGVPYALVSCSVVK